MRHEGESRPQIGNGPTLMVSHGVFTTLSRIDEAMAFDPRFSSNGMGSEARGCLLLAVPTRPHFETPGWGPGLVQFSRFSSEKNPDKGGLLARAGSNTCAQ